LELVAKSDVIIENFRTGTLEKWGLGMDVLRQANPDIGSSEKSITIFYGRIRIVYVRRLKWAEVW